jgi:hypothetical protein
MYMHKKSNTSDINDMPRARLAGYGKLKVKLKLIVEAFISPGPTPMQGRTDLFD